MREHCRLTPAEGLAHCSELGGSLVEHGRVEQVSTFSGAQPSEEGFGWARRRALPSVLPNGLDQAQLSKPTDGEHTQPLRGGSPWQRNQGGSIAEGRRMNLGRLCQACGPQTVVPVGMHCRGCRSRMALGSVEGSSAIFLLTSPFLFPNRHGLWFTLPLGRQLLSHPNLAKSGHMLPCRTPPVRVMIQRSEAIIYSG